MVSNGCKSCEQTVYSLKNAESNARFADSMFCMYPFLYIVLLFYPCDNTVIQLELMRYGRLQGGTIMNYNEVEKHSNHIHH